MSQPRPLDIRQMALLLALAVLVILLWDTWFVYPLKILVVIFHEASHAAAALATGGSVVGMEISSAEGGACVTSGGSRFLILSAGYLGSLACGGVVLLLAVRTRHDRAVATLMGIALAGLALWLIRPLNSFGFVFSATVGTALILAGIYLKQSYVDFVLKVIGLTSCLYAVLDIKSDVLDRNARGSDAAQLAELTGVPALAWGAGWIAVAALASVWFLLAACRKDVPAGAAS